MQHVGAARGKQAGKYTPFDEGKAGGKEERGEKAGKTGTCVCSYLSCPFVFGTAGERGKYYLF